MLLIFLISPTIMITPSFISLVLLMMMPTIVLTRLLTAPLLQFLHSPTHNILTGFVVIFMLYRTPILMDILSMMFCVTNADADLP